MIRKQSFSEASADASEINQRTGFKLLENKEFLVSEGGVERNPEALW
jgi:hypothetical protein